MNRSTRLDQEAKLRVKEALVRHAVAGLRGLTGGEVSERRSGQLDRETSLEVDDTSHSYEAGDLQGLYEEAAERSRGKVDSMRHLDFSITDVVAPGAIVGFGGDRYVVGVASGPFDCDGVSYEGIDTDSPVYAEIQGKRSGETFTLGGRQERIDFVA